MFDLTGYPVIDAQRGGSLNGLVDAANRIVDLAIVRDWQEGGTMIIPGHGRIADQADMVEYREMLTIVRDRVQESIKKGMTLAQVKAARPMLDYDGRYGSPDAFIEAAFRDLSGKSRRDHHEGHNDTNERRLATVIRAVPRRPAACANNTSACRVFLSAGVIAQRGQPAILRRHRHPGRRPRSISPVTGCRW